MRWPSAPDNIKERWPAAPDNPLDWHPLGVVDEAHRPLVALGTTETRIIYTHKVRAFKDANGKVLGAKAYAVLLFEPNMTWWDIEAYDPSIRNFEPGWNDHI